MQLQTRGEVTSRSKVTIEVLMNIIQSLALHLLSTSSKQLRSVDMKQCLACEAERLCLSVVCRSERRRLPAEAELPARRIPEPEPELVLIRCGFVPDPDRRFHRLQTPYNTRSQPLGFILNTYNDSTVSVLFYRFWSRGFGYDIAGLEEISRYLCYNLVN